MKEESDILFRDEAYRLVGLGMEVHRELGCGFLEPVYQEAFEILLQRDCIPYEREKLLRIKFKDQYLRKEYLADFVCFDKIVLEFKAVSSLNCTHESQVLNYLKATGLHLGLLFNFGERSFTYRRIVL